MLNQTFNELKLKKHPDKTIMGRTEKGFDFLGYHFGSEGLSLAEKTIENFISRATRLYEQQKTAPGGNVVLGEYVKRWLSILFNTQRSWSAWISGRIRWGSTSGGTPLFQ